MCLCVVLQARAGVGSTTDVLRLLQSFTDETNFTVWQKICSDLSTINRLVSYTDFAESFRKFAQPLFAKIVERLGWTSKNNECMLNIDYCYVTNCLFI